MWMLEPAAGPLYAVAFLPDGRLITAGQDGIIRRYAVGELEREWEPEQGPIRCVDISPKGKYLALGTDARPLCFDLEAGKAVGPAAPAGMAVAAIGFWGDAKTLAVAAGDRIKSVTTLSGFYLWDVNAGRVRQRPSSSHYQGGFRAAAFHPATRRAALAGDNRTLLMHDLGRPEPMAIRTAQEKLGAVAFDPAGRRVALGFDWKIKLYPFGLGESAEWSGHRAQVTALAFTPDGETLLSGDGSGEVRAWNAAAGRTTRAMALPIGRVRALAASPDGMTFAAAGEAGITVVCDLD